MDDMSKETEEPEPFHKPALAVAMAHTDRLVIELRDALRRIPPSNGLSANEKRPRPGKADGGDCHNE